MKPNKIILIRHGESQGNVDWTMYNHTPDYAIYLTEKGKEQAREVGKKLYETIEGDYGCIYSPYFRARQTMDEAMKFLPNNTCVFQKEEPRIREQEYSGQLRKGKHDKDAHRDEYGKFFFRMDGGESGADVYDRISAVIGDFHREFKKADFPKNLCIFGHGMTNRLFLVRWLRIPIEVFETWKNPRNGQMYILELQKDNKYKLITTIECHPKGYGHQYNP